MSSFTALPHQSQSPHRPSPSRAPELVLPDETFCSILATTGASSGTPKRTLTARTTQFADKELTLSERLEADDGGVKQEVDYDWYDKSGRSRDGASSFMRSLSKKSLGRASSMKSWASKHRKDYRFFGKSKVTFLILNAVVCVMCGFAWCYRARFIAINVVAGRFPNQKPYF